MTHRCIGLDNGLQARVSLQNEDFSRSASGLKQDLEAPSTAAPDVIRSLMVTALDTVRLLNSQEMSWGLVSSAEEPHQHFCRLFAAVVAKQLESCTDSGFKALILSCGLRKCVGYWSEWNKNIKWLNVPRHIFFCDSFFCDLDQFLDFFTTAVEAQVWFFIWTVESLEIKILSCII